MVSPEKSHIPLTFAMKAFQIGSLFLAIMSMSNAFTAINVKPCSYRHRADERSRSFPGRYHQQEIFATQREMNEKARRYIKMRDFDKLRNAGASAEELKEFMSNGTIGDD